MKTIAAVYGRVSTPQQEQEATIESQVAAIEMYAEQQGYGLNASLYFLDQAVSGAQLARPQLDQLRDQPRQKSRDQRLIIDNLREGIHGFGEFYSA